MFDGVLTMRKKRSANAIAARMMFVCERISCDSNTIRFRVLPMC